MLGWRECWGGGRRDKVGEERREGEERRDGEERREGEEEEEIEECNVKQNVHNNILLGQLYIIQQNIIFCRLNDSELDRKYALAGMRRCG